MKLKVKINNIEYDKTVSGATFSEEFNETLDSGSIIISHVPKIQDLKPYDDVFIYNSEDEFNGYINKGDIVPYSGEAETKLVDIPTGATQTEINIVEGTNIIIDFDDYNYYIYGTIVDIWQYFCFNFNNENANKKCRFLVNLLFDIVFLYNTYDQEGNVVVNSLDLNNYYPGSNVGGKHASRNDDLRFFSQDNPLAESIDIYWDNVNKRIVVPKFTTINNRAGEISLVTVSSQTTIFEREQSNETTLKFNSIETPLLNETSLNVLIGGKYYSFILENWEEIEENITYGGGFSCYEEIPNIFSFYGTYFFIVFQKTDNGYEAIINRETSATDDLFLLVDGVQIAKLNYLQTVKTSLPKFYKHLLVDNYIEEQLTFGDEPLYKYKISLFSETKRLEKTVLPNVSITQSIFSEKRSCLFYLKHFVEFYSPKIKKQSNIINKEWEYVSKYSLDLNLIGEEYNEQCVDAIFGDVPCPEMSLTNPSLREILSRIMIVKDCIPIVKDDVIYAMQIGEIKDINTNFGEKFGGTFNYNENYMSFPVYSMNSSDYTTGARREYSGAISQENSARYIEYLGFRNSNSALMTLDNLQIETRFPIYKINKLYLCYYKKVTIIISENGETTEKEKVFMCKHDITDLILQNSVRNALSADWTQYPDEINSRDDMKKYRVLTLGYDIGGKVISGWGTKYTYIPEDTSFLAWFSREKTYLENVLDLLENHFNQGSENLRELVRQKLGMIGSNIFADEEQAGRIKTENWDWNNSMITNPDNLSGSQKIKSVFFQMDYNAMYSGAVLHSKDNTEEDDIATSDNCSSALSILEVDGLFEKEKMNRVGNKTFNLQGRYPDFDTMQENNNVLGSVFDDNIVVYHREYSIYNDYIQASFTGTYDYVMKNYFTTVFAKLRTYNFMSYEESTLRSENEKWFVSLDSSVCYFETNNINSYYLLSAFNKTQTPTYYGDLNYPLLVNGGYFVRYITHYEIPIRIEEVKYYSDFNSFVSGYSLCFNIQMFDNVTHGVYINTIDTTVNDAPDAKGSLQDWYVATDTPDDAFIKKIGCFVGHFDKKDYFCELPQTYTDDVKEKIQNRLSNIYKLPKAFDDNTETLFLGVEKDFDKDNKEILDITFQFEPVSYDKNIVFSQWLMKLNDLSTSYLKFDTNINVYDFAGLTAEDSEKINIYYTLDFEWKTVGIITDGYYTPTIFIRFSDSLEISTGSLQLTSSLIKNWISNPDGIGVNENFLQIMPLEITKVENQGNTLIVRCLVSEQRYRYKILQETKQTEKEYAFVNTLSSEEGYTDYVCYFSEYERTITAGGIFYMENAYFNKESPSSELSVSNSFIFEGYYADSINPVVTYPQTMYILDSEELVDKKLVYNSIELNNIPTGMKVMNVSNFNDVFSVEHEENGTPYINIDTSSIISQRTSDSKSLQYWFKDKDGVLRFVFGVNISNTEVGKKVYLSLIKNRSKKVYDAFHNPTAHIVDYLSAEDSQDVVYGEGQKYKENE